MAEVILARQRLFGLGKTKDNKNIGSYAVLIDSNNISASNGSQTLAVSIAGADAVITGQKEHGKRSPLIRLQSIKAIITPL